MTKSQRNMTAEGLPGTNSAQFVSPAPEGNKCANGLRKQSVWRKVEKRNKWKQMRTEIKEEAERYRLRGM